VGARHRICAIIVTHHPDGAFPDRLAAIASQVARVYIVDNGSNPERLATLSALVANTDHVLIANRSNLGVARALNQGATAARAAGFEWAITLDQDSLVTDGMVERLWQTWYSNSSDAPVAIVTPVIQDRLKPNKSAYWIRPSKRFPLMFERVDASRVDSHGVTMAITSGALTNLDAWAKLDGFWAELFIDFVDFEYCLRARRAGYRILVSQDARLIHRLGARRAVSFLGFRLTALFHSPKRVYYIWRNRLAVIKRHGLSTPHWLLYEIFFAPIWTVRILVLEDQRWPKFMAMVRGTLDGILGRLGPAPAGLFDDDRSR